jgi:hypothetical protein
LGSSVVKYVTVGPNTRSSYHVPVASLRCKLLIVTRSAPSIRIIRLNSTYYIYLPTFISVPRLAMDLFIFYPEYHVPVCKSCAYAVAPPRLAAHIATKHANDICSKDSLHRATKTAATLASRLKKEYDLLDPTTDTIPHCLQSRLSPISSSTVAISALTATLHKQRQRQF